MSPLIDLAVGLIDRLIDCWRCLVINWLCTLQVLSCCQKVKNHKMIKCYVCYWHCYIHLHTLFKCHPGYQGLLAAHWRSWVDFYMLCGPTCKRWHGTGFIRLKRCDVFWRVITSFAVSSLGISHGQSHDFKLEANRSWSSGITRAGGPPCVTPSRGWRLKEKKFCGQNYKEQWKNEVGQVKRCGWHPTESSKRWQWWPKKVVSFFRKKINRWHCRTGRDGDD